MAAGAAHELNNPLSVIVGYLGLILAGQTAPAQLTEQLERVAKEAQHCRVVLQGLTELAEATLADPEQLDLRAILADAVATLGLAPALTVSVVGDARIPLLGQASGLSRFVAHAMKNAVEASARTLSVSVTQSSDVTRLELRDDGRGMSDAVLSRAREPFFSTKAEQLGLGLAVCDAVAWAHGGSLSLGSSEGRGTTLTLTLPVKSAAEVAA